MGLFENYSILFRVMNSSMWRLSSCLITFLSIYHLNVYTYVDKHWCNCSDQTYLLQAFHNLDYFLQKKIISNNKNTQKKN